MTFYKTNALQEISDLLSTVAVSIALKKALGFYDDLQIVEDFFAGFLSRLWDRDYINENLLEQNAAAVDLSDRAARAVVQVTSDTGLDKIRSTMEKFNSHGLGNDFDELRFVYPVVRSLRGDRRAQHRYLRHPISISIETSRTFRPCKSVGPCQRQNCWNCSTGPAAKWHERVPHSEQPMRRTRSTLWVRCSQVGRKFAGSGPIEM